MTPLQEMSGEDASLKDRLGCLATKLQGHIQDIAERERCSLGSLELEMHGGEVKVSTYLSIELGQDRKVREGESEVDGY